MYRLGKFPAVAYSCRPDASLPLTSTDANLLSPNRAKFSSFPSCLCLAHKILNSALALFYLSFSYIFWTFF